MILMESNGQHVQYNTIVSAVAITKLSFIFEVFIA
jgi:hypothetical protein